MIKRDDLTGLATGGNKTRYLEFVLADALAKGADTVVLSSGNQSNHCRQLAAGAARLGLHCVLLFWGSEPAELDGNLLLDEVLGAELEFLDLAGDEPDPFLAAEAPPDDKAGLDRAIERTMTRLRAKGRRPYCVNTDAPGGLAAVGYVQCGVELARQLRDAGVGRAHVFAVSGGGTHAGLAAAASLLAVPDPPFRVTGICYAGRHTAGRHERIAAGARRAAQLLGYDISLDPGEIESDPTYASEPLFAGTDARWAPVLDVARTEGILLEPSYTGRAILAIADRIKAGTLPPDETIVVLHSGGLPLLSPLWRRRRQSA